MNKKHASILMIVLTAICAVASIPNLNWLVSPLPTIEAGIATSSQDAISFGVANNTLEAVIPVGAVLVFGEQNLCYQLDVDEMAVIQSGEAVCIDLKEIGVKYFDVDVIDRNIDNKSDAVAYLAFKNLSGESVEIETQVDVGTVAAFLQASSRRLVN